MTEETTERGDYDVTTMSKLEPSHPVLYIIFHEDHDGYVGAAIAASTNKHGYKDMKLCPTNYGKEIPIKIEDLKETDTVYVIDFSYKKEILEEINSKVKLLVVLDHHESMREEISGLPYVIFDNSRSGAKLAWDYFTDGYYGSNPVVDIVDAYDLWNKKFHLTHRGTNLKWKHVIGYHLGTMEKQDNIEFWKEQISKFSVDFASLERGMDLYGTVLETAENVEQSAVTRHVRGTTGFNGLVFAGSKESLSLVSDALLYDVESQEVKRDITFCYFTPKDEPGKMVVSMRSAIGSEEKITAMAVAKSLGGGGHRHAAGAKIEYLGLLENFPDYLMCLLEEKYDQGLAEVLL